MENVEIWKDIEEFKGSYQVSNLGNVRSVERFIYTRTYPSKPIKLAIGNQGCVIVRLRNGKKQLIRSVGKLVALTFIGEPPKNARQVKHLDGNPNNNRLDNLKWDVNKSYGLPLNQKARELFYNEAAKNVNIYVRKNKLYNISFGEVDIDDFKQECLLAIWNIIDILEHYEPDRFYSFCSKKCDFVFKRFYKKYKNRHRYTYFSSYVNEKGECYAENLKELSYIEDFDKYDLSSISRNYKATTKLI